jgi:hypothetical protein
LTASEIVCIIRFMSNNDDKNILVYLDGSKNSFRCEVCGSNVFHKHEEREDVYICNGCSEQYIGEK